MLPLKQIAEAVRELIIDKDLRRYGSVCNSVLTMLFPCGPIAETMYETRLNATALDLLCCPRKASEIVVQEAGERLSAVQQGKRAGLYSTRVLAD